MHLFKLESHNFFKILGISNCFLVFKNSDLPTQVDYGGVRDVEHLNFHFHSIFNFHFHLNFQFQIICSWF